ncbi:MAG: hypothetical protein GY737_14510 [Desulfobacteraceae bacterium]|nr:hypothetical protein [Desulfobacteraceae bacterium]
MALNLIAERKQSTLIIVHTKELLHQWVERAGQFLGMNQGRLVSSAPASLPWTTGSPWAWCRLFANGLMRSRTGLVMWWLMNATVAHQRPFLTW